MPLSASPPYVLLLAVYKTQSSYFLWNYLPISSELMVKLGRMLYPDNKLEAPEIVESDGEEADDGESDGDFAGLGDGHLDC